MSTSIRTISFYRDNVNPLVASYQRRVFEHLGYAKHLQLEFSGNHGEAVDHFLRDDSEWTNLAIFDIDAFPLSRVWEQYFDEDGVVGGAQRASHIEGSDLYASAAWIMFSRQTWMDLGCPSFAPSAEGDTASAFTYRARELRRPVTLIWPTDVEFVVPTWAPLADGIRNGMGTTWGGVVYHAFGSRFFGRSTLLFLRRARRVLGLHPFGRDVLGYQCQWLMARARSKATGALGPARSSAR